MMANETLNMFRDNGVSINLISRESLESFRSRDRVNFVLNEVKAGKVLVLEMGLSAMEEAQLIEQTMRSIDHETFIGIEIQSHAREEAGTWLDRLLKRKKTPRMAVIGPANLLRTIHKDGNIIQTMLVTKEQVIEHSDMKEDVGLGDHVKDNMVLEDVIGDDPEMDLEDGDEGADRDDGHEDPDREDIGDVDTGVENDDRIIEDTELEDDVEDMTSPIIKHKDIFMDDATEDYGIAEGGT